MATEWVLGKISDALSPTVSGWVATGGSYAGGAVHAVGSKINGVGEGIGSSITRYGNGVQDYGNAIMDWTNAGGTRASTASNPLGLSSGAYGAKQALTSPTIYTAPKKSPSKILMTTSKTAAAPQKKITGSTSAPKNGTSKTPAKKPVIASTASVPRTSTPAKQAASKAGINPGAMPKTSSVNRAAVSAGSKPKVSAASKPTPAVKKTTATAPGRAPTKSAGDPLGLKGTSLKV